MSIKTIKTALASLFAMMTSTAEASTNDLHIKQVTDNIYAIVGELGQRSQTNLGNNATFGLIVTDAGAVLVDPGATYKGAEQLAAAIRTVTDKPVKIVINSGGQDHRWLGNSFFKAKGANIIASAAAVADQRDRVNGQLQGLESLVGENGIQGTKAVYAERIFKDTLSFDFGGIDFKLISTGGAHTPGDIVTWLPQKRVVFAGDVVYLERVLGIGSFSNFKNWMPAFEAMAALKPKYIIPGHGSPSTMERARAETYNYLINLKERVSKVLETGGEIKAAIAVDQGSFKYLRNFDLLARRNAQEVFIQLEFDF